MVASICLLMAFLGLSMFNGIGVGSNVRSVYSKEIINKSMIRTTKKKQTPSFDLIKDAIETIKTTCKDESIHLIHQKITLNEHHQLLSVNKRLYWKKYRQKPTKQAKTFTRLVNEPVEKFEFIYRGSQKDSFVAIYKDKNDHITKKERVYFT